MSAELFKDYDKNISEGWLSAELKLIVRHEEIIKSRELLLQQYTDYLNEEEEKIWKIKENQAKAKMRNKILLQDFEKFWQHVKDHENNQNAMKLKSLKSDFLSTVNKILQVWKQKECIRRPNFKSRYVTAV